MKIAFVTTQSLSGSTVVGRVLPLAEELGKKHEVVVLGHATPSSISPSREGEKKWGWVSVGRDPFTRASQGKKRLGGISLVIRLKWNAIFAAIKLVTLKPDVIIIVKSLPENVFATWLATRLIHPKKIILDVDDFELTANVLTSLAQRAAIHWAERAAAKLADQITAATPFLVDHFQQLTQDKKTITMIPTGLAPHPQPFSSLEEKGAGLVYAGSLSLSSGHRIDLLPEILFEVRKKFPDIQLHIYGDGDDTEKLKNMFIEKKLENAVVWHGRFVLTSLTKERSSTGEVVFLDPIDNTITNRAKSSFRVALAAALGLPVVTSDIGIRPYVVPDFLHSKFFAKPADTQDYAAKIIALLQQPLSPAESDALQAHAGKFTWLQLAQKYEKILAA